jgi:hypothetical protein
MRANPNLDVVDTIPRLFPRPHCGHGKNWIFSRMWVGNWE